MCVPHLKPFFVPTKIQHTNYYSPRRFPTLHHTGSPERYQCKLCGHKQRDRDHTSHIKRLLAYAIPTVLGAKGRTHANSAKLQETRGKNDPLVVSPCTHTRVLYLSRPTLNACSYQIMWALSREIADGASALNGSVGVHALLCSECSGGTDYVPHDTRPRRMISARLTWHAKIVAILLL